LFTVCPKCTLTLVVTTVDLRAGQGYVRCGRCANVFNALIALREGDPASGTSDTAKRRLLETAPKSVDPAPGVGVEMDPEPEPVAEPEPEPQAEPEPEQEPDVAPEPDTEPEPEIAAEDIVLSEEGEAEPAEEGSLEFDAAATDVSEIFISPGEAEHDTTSGNYEAVVMQVEPTPDPPPVAEPEDDPAHTDTVAADDWSLLDDDEPPADAESVIEESPLTFGGSAADAAETSEPATPTTQPDPAWVEQMFAEAEAQAVAKLGRGPGRRASDIAVETAPFAEEEAEAESAAVGKPPPTQPSDAALAPLLVKPVTMRPSWQYVAGIAGLVLLFGLQVAHFNRQSLAINPTFGPIASTIYGWFGATLSPRWDLTAYSVRQLGADSEDAEGTRLRVRVSLHNESARVQPFPLLRLTLSDRFGNPVATRDLEPADYLPKRIADQRLLEPDQRVDAEVHVLDPGKTAMGFVVDACLRASNGNIGCTADARAKSRAPS
jgi:predicted Zn finger-like uncharacterized protein